MLATRLKSLLERSSSTMAGSLPPSSTQTGVRAFAADAQTWCATGLEPMNVMCDMDGWDVRWSATLGQQTTDCTMSGEWPHASRARVAMDAKYEDDQAVASEPLTMMALPAKMEAMTGLMRLWNG
jgi:hypothetical protein